MGQRSYYSMRRGRSREVDLSMLLELFYGVYNEFWRKNYFQEAFGYECVDAGPVEGKLGADIGWCMLRALHKSNLWTIGEKYKDYSEEDLFDVIEFLYDHVSRPLDGDYHSWNDCGWHYNVFDQGTGRQEFRTELNNILHHYKGGFELSEAGEILALPEHGLEHLLRARLPNYDPENVEARVEVAIQKFRNRHSSESDKRDAVRDLADVLEFLRPKLQQAITKKDENDLFNIANGFAIRHHDGKGSPSFWVKVVEQG